LLTFTECTAPLLQQHEYEGVPVRNRRPHFFALSLPAPTFLGKDAVAWFITHKHSADRAAALRLGNSLLKHGFITHAAHTRTFEDSTTCYSFAAAQCAEAQARGRGEVAGGELNSAGYSLEQSGDARGFCYNYSASNDGNSSSRFSEGRYVVESCPSSWEEGLDDVEDKQIDASGAVVSSISSGSDPPLLHPVLAKTSAGEAAARASLHEQVKEQLELQQQHLQQLQLQQPQQPQPFQRGSLQQQQLQQQQQEGAAESRRSSVSVSSSALTL
jgi:Domain found in Dishevelled, Egl-10, and Pleckstrin (DEP)